MFLSTRHLATIESTYNKRSKEESWKVIPKRKLDPIFKATVEATEEAIVNALVAANDMECINGNKVFALPHNRLKDIVGRHKK